MSQVAYVGYGSAHINTGNVNGWYLSSGLQANDLMLLRVTVSDISNTPTTPSGWTLLYGPDSTGTGRQWIYYKISDGTETGSFIVTTNSVALCYAQICVYRNTLLSSFVEGGGFASGSDDSVEAVSVATGGYWRMVVAFVFVNAYLDVLSFTGESGGDWIRKYGFKTEYGDDGGWCFQDAIMASGGTISGGSYTMAGSAPWGVRAFALLPSLAADDIGLRMRTSGGIIKIGVQLLDGHKLRIRKGGTTFGIPLITPGGADDSGLRIYDGSAVKALPKVA